MKAFVLYYDYPCEGGGKPVRAYTEEYAEQATRDLNLLRENSTDMKDWKLEVVELYNPIQPSFVDL